MSLTPWDWTEVGEGIFVALLFIVAPLGWRAEKHHKANERRHAEAMEAHRKVHEHLGIK